MRPRRTRPPGRTRRRSCRGPCPGGRASSPAPRCRASSASRAAVRSGPRCSGARLRQPVIRIGRFRSPSGGSLPSGCLRADLGSPGDAVSPRARDLHGCSGSTIPLSLLDGGLRLTSTMVESVRWRRLRWRLRGAWQWPAFRALTAVAPVLVARLPFQGEGTDAMGAFLVAGFFNLLAVALLAPVFGWLLRKRRRDLPFLIARDYAGAVLLVVITCGLLAGGLVHHSAVLDQRADQRAVTRAVGMYI